MKNQAATRNEILGETRNTFALAYYTSQPYDIMEAGEDQPTETICTISVSIRGTDDLGYILHTRDEADGPSDDLGSDIYPTLAAALAALRGKIADAEDGWIEESMVQGLESGQTVLC
jgi:hypothetical protein